MTRRISDIPLVAIAFTLSVFGIAMVYSAGQTDTESFVTGLWRTQGGWFVIAMCAAFVASRASVRLLEWLTPFAYVLTLLMLILTLVIGGGAGTAASSKSWLVIGGIRIGQPAELAKLTVVLMLARVLANRREPPESLLELWHPALVVGIPESPPQSSARIVGSSPIRRRTRKALLPIVPPMVARECVEGSGP